MMAIWLLLSTLFKGSGKVLGLQSQDKPQLGMQGCVPLLQVSKPNLVCHCYLACDVQEQQQTWHIYA